MNGGTSLRFGLRVLMPALALLVSGQSMAAWPNDPNVNLRVTDDFGSEYLPRIVMDESGNVIITWYGNERVYAKRVLANGTLDPSWPTASLSLSANSPEIVPDGGGGAIISWYDYRTGNGDVYAQRVLSDGTIAPGWPLFGTLVSATSANELAPQIVADGAGGAILTWTEYFTGAQADIHSHHVLANGTLDPAWGASARDLCVIPGFQDDPRITTDDAGGAIIVWDDDRNSNRPNIYAQRVLANGTIAPGWPVNGIQVCPLGSRQYLPELVPDGDHGAIVGWIDTRAGYIVCAQHVTGSGVLDPAWPGDGQVLESAETDTVRATLAPDAAGGAFAAWIDHRTGPRRAFAHHVLASGALDPAWPPEGRALSLGGIESRPEAVSDGKGGVIVTWQSGVTDTSDIKATRLNADGTLAAGWPSAGVDICTAPSFQEWPAITGDGTGGGVITWMDRRGGGYDIYAQRVNGNGVLGGDIPTPTLLSLMSTSSTSDGIEIRWQFADPAAHGDVVVERADAESGPYVGLALAPRQDGGFWSVLDRNVAEGNTYWYRLEARTSEDAAQRFGPIMVSTAGAIRELALSPIRPNPARGPMRIGFALPRSADVTLDVIDASGRRMIVLEEGRYPAGRHEMTWSGASRRGPIVPGLYFIRLRAEGRSLCRRMVIVR